MNASIVGAKVKSGSLRTAAGLALFLAGCGGGVGTGFSTLQTGCARRPLEEPVERVAVYARCEFEWGADYACGEAVPKGANPGQWCADLHAAQADLFAEPPSAVGWSYRNIASD